MTMERHACGWTLAMLLAALVVMLHTTQAEPKFGEEEEERKGSMGWEGLLERIELMEAHSKSREGQLMGRIEFLETKNKMLDRQIQNMSRELNEVKGLAKVGALAPVGFTAWAGETRDYNAGDRLQFDQILSNFNGNYDATNSEFTVPYSGIYMISVGILTTDSKDMTADVNMGGTFLFQVTSRSLPDASAHATAMAFVDCVVGAKVYVTSIADGNQMYGNESRESLFSVYLMLSY